MGAVGGMDGLVGAGGRASGSDGGWSAARRCGVGFGLVEPKPPSPRSVDVRKLDLTKVGRATQSKTSCAILVLASAWKGEDVVFERITFMEPR